MARYLRRNRDFSADITAFAQRRSVTECSHDHMLGADLSFAPLMIDSAAVTFLIALGPPTHFTPALRLILIVVGGYRTRSAIFLVASGSMALALNDAGSWSFNRIIGERRANDRSERA